jgi:hypothetical protein
MTEKLPKVLSEQTAEDFYIWCAFNGIEQIDEILKCLYAYADYLEEPVDL